MDCHAEKMRLLVVPAPDHVRNAAKFLLKMGYGG
jgi:hypothetical protein